MSKSWLLAFPLFAVALPVQADEVLPPATDIGSLMSVYMCEQVIETGSLSGEEEEYYDRFAEALLEQYGESTTEIVGLKMTTAFDLPPEEASQDPYVQEMFRAVFQNIIDDDVCFEAFLAHEVLK